MKATDQIEFKALNKAFDKLKEFDEKHGWIDYFIAPLIVTLIVLVVYAIKGVYPFGVNTVAYYDMPSTSIPGFTYTWDVLHGFNSAFLDWYTALGALNSSGLSTILFPANLFFYFINRNSILFSVSIFLLIKLALCAFTMSYYFKNRFIDTAGTVFAGILYAFCGFNIQYYNNIGFLDFAIIFPILVFSFEHLIQEHKYILFTIIMFFIFIQNPQFIFMIAIYLVFKGYFILNSISAKKKGRSLRLFMLSIIVSVMMACCVLIPEIVQLRHSARIEIEGSGFDYVAMMKNVFNQFRRQKHMILYGSEIAIGLFFLLILRGKNIIKKYYENICIIFILGLPILHEGINLLWHMGSYKHFPLRFGYMLTFECLVMVGKYISSERSEGIKYIGKCAKILGYASIPFVAYVLFDFMAQFIEEGISTSDAYHSYWLYLVTISFLYFVIFLMESKAARNGAFIILALIQGFCGCYGFIAPKDGNIDNFRIKYVLNAMNLFEEFKGKTDYTARIKANPAEYESNYSDIARQPAISSWSYGVNAELEKELKDRMCYDGLSSYIMDCGGTVFTDALLSVRRVASSSNPDEMLYTNDISKKNVYDCIYTLPFGMVIDNEEIKNDSVAFEYNNNLFSSITGIKDKLIEIVPADDFIDSVKELTEDEKDSVINMFEENAQKEDNGGIKTDTEKTEDESDQENVNITDDQSKNDENQMKEYDLKIQVSGKKSIYLHFDEPLEDVISIVANGKPIYFDSIVTRGLYIYPVNARCGIVALGSGEDEVFNIEIYTTNDSLKNLSIGLLDLNILSDGIDVMDKNQSLSADFYKSKINITGKANKSGTLFLPIAYSDNWHAKVNGTGVKVKPYINDAFVAIDVQKGDVDIEFSYLPKGLISGIILSALGIIIAVLLIFFEKRGGIRGKKIELILDKIFIYGYTGVVYVLFIVMYIVPIYIKMAL